MDRAEGRSVSGSENNAWNRESAEGSAQKLSGQNEPVGNAAAARECFLTAQSPNGRLEHLLGLAARAGRIKSGTFLTEEAIRGKTASLVILAADAEKNSRKTVLDKCRFYHVPVCEYGTKQQLGKAIGKGDRSCIAVADDGFAKAMEQLMVTREGERGNDGENENQ